MILFFNYVFLGHTFPKPLRKLKTLRLHSSRAGDLRPPTFGRLFTFDFSTPSMPHESTSGKKTACPFLSLPTKIFDIFIFT